jgi:hypothetical protein
VSLDARVCEKRKNLTTDESREYLTTEGTEGTEEIAKIISFSPFSPFFSVPSVSSVVSHLFFSASLPQPAMIS